MEDIKKLQELLDLIKDKTNSTTAEKLATIRIANEVYKEIFDTDIMNMLLGRIVWEIESDIMELEYIDGLNCGDVPF